jgi:transcriptional antiterminator NusG
MGAPDKLRDQWYVIHVRAGMENRVRDSMLRRIETEEMGDYVYEVLVPTERISEVKKGKRTESTRKFYPGYIIANLFLFDENNKLVDKSWYFVKETDGVLNFAGTKDRPIAMRPREVEGMLAQVREREDAIKPKIAFSLGDTVRVADGPFESQTGVVEEIDPERGVLRVAVNIFGTVYPCRSRILAGREGLVRNPVKHFGCTGQNNQSLKQTELSHGKRNRQTNQASDQGWSSKSCTSNRSGARSGRRQHHGFLQGVQCSDAEAQW